MGLQVNSIAYHQTSRAFITFCCYILFFFVVEKQSLQTLALYLVTQSSATLCDPMDSSPPGSSVHGDFPGKNTGVGCHAFLQGIFPTQGSNPGFLRCRRILHQGSPNVQPLFESESNLRIAAVEKNSLQSINLQLTAVFIQPVSINFRKPQ